jgi:flagellum-specific peptidoglycan hydrolase FlgJ
MIESIKKLEKKINICVSLVIILTAISLICNAMTLGFINTRDPHEEYICEKYTDNIRDNYIRSRLNLIDSVNKYIYTIAPTAVLNGDVLVDVCSEYNFDLKFALAQGQLESHFGTAGMASKTNSVFNVGAFDNANYNKINGIYKYKHPDYSVEPYVKLVTTSYLSDKTTEKDLLIEFKNHQNKRYASNPNYENQLTDIYNKINTIVDLDDAYSKYVKYKILCGV